MLVSLWTTNLSNLCPSFRKFCVTTTKNIPIWKYSTRREHCRMDEIQNLCMNKFKSLADDWTTHTKERIQESQKHLSVRNWKHCRDILVVAHCRGSKVYSLNLANLTTWCKNVNTLQRDILKCRISKLYYSNCEPYKKQLLNMLRNWIYDNNQEKRIVNKNQPWGDPYDTVL